MLWAQKLVIPKNSENNWSHGWSDGNNSTNCSALMDSYYVGEMLRYLCDNFASRDSSTPFDIRTFLQINEQNSSHLITASSNYNPSNQTTYVSASCLYGNRLDFDGQSCIRQYAFSRYLVGDFSPSLKSALLRFDNGFLVSSPKIEITNELLSQNPQIQFTALNTGNYSSELENIFHECFGLASSAAYYSSINIKPQEN
ncbi:MAG: hypothetical protein SFU25_01165 [Candidatus Caenarcaniphilales bacterium]|nr:hypothetical protein [Candidatus Caenarcaniphilales bacterium]